MANLSHLYLRKGKSVENFITHVNICHLDIPKPEFVKLVQSGLNCKLKKKFEGMEFRSLFKLVSHATRFEEILREKY